MQDGIVNFGGVPLKLVHEVWVGNLMTPVFWGGQSPLKNPAFHTHMITDHSPKILDTPTHRDYGSHVETKTPKVQHSEKMVVGRRSFWGPIIFFSGTRKLAVKLPGSIKNYLYSFYLHIIHPGWNQTFWLRFSLVGDSHRRKLCHILEMAFLLMLFNHSATMVF